MDLRVLKTTNVVVDLNVVFGFSMSFLNKHFDNIELNIVIYEKILKFIRFGGSVTNDLKNFVRFMIMNGEKYHLIEGFNALSAFAIGYNKSIGFINFKTDVLGFNKAVYSRVIKNNYTKNCLMLNFKSEVVDINNRYFIVPHDMFEIVFDDAPINEIFDRVMIKTFKLKVPYSKRGIPLSDLLFEYKQYSEKTKINHDTYYQQDSYLRYLVNIFFDYYNSGECSFRNFTEFLRNRGIRIYNDLKEYSGQITIDEYLDHEKEINKGFELINTIYYTQLINFIKSKKGLYKHSITLSEYTKFLSFIIELKEKNIRFDKNLIIFVLNNKTQILFKDKYKKFIESL